MFTCPHCQSELQSNKSRFGLFWTCPSCKGRALTLELVRKIVSPVIANKLWQRTITGGYPEKRKCPSCSNPMTEVPIITDKKTVYLDACKKCHFIWFDNSEFRLLPKKPQEIKQPENEISIKAKQALAIAQVQLMNEQQRELADCEDPSFILALLFNLPIDASDEETENTPILTWILSFVMAAIGLFCLFTYFDVSNNLIKYKEIIDNWGLIPAQFTRHFGLTLLTSFFLNSNIYIGALSIYLLLVFGEHVEDVLGKWRFSFLTFCSIFAGSVFFVMCNHSSTLPFVGSSAGVTGIIAYYAFKFPFNEVKFLYGMRGYYRWASQPAIYVFVGWLGVQLFIFWKQLHGWDIMEPFSGIANIAGAVTGFLFCLFDRLKELKTNKQRS
ncbi:MAG: rhomboid family intramembrane serine protease [Phycisphaerales bacterium]